jgi:hypothetical protein
VNYHRYAAFASFTIVATTMLAGCGAEPVVEQENIASVEQPLQHDMAKIIYFTKLARGELIGMLRERLEELIGKYPIKPLPIRWESLAVLSAPKSLVASAAVDGLESSALEEVAMGAEAGLLFCERAAYSFGSVKGSISRVRIRAVEGSNFVMDFIDIKKNKLMLTKTATVSEVEPFVARATVTIGLRDGSWDYGFRFNNVSITTTLDSNDLAQLEAINLPPKSDLVEVNDDMRADLGDIFAALDAADDSFALSTDFTVAARENDLVVNVGRSGIDKIGTKELDEGVFLGLVASATGEKGRLDKLVVKGESATWIPLEDSLVIAGVIKRGYSIRPPRVPVIGAYLKEMGQAASYAWSVGEQRFDVYADAPQP